jgi:hypothetical protein
MRHATLLVILALAGGLPAPAHAQSSAGKAAPNAPSDPGIPVVAQCQWMAMLKAMEPYVARARETYPEARRRFVARTQPARPMFVTARLDDASGHHEQVFVAVDSIVGPRIFGWLVSEINVVHGYRYRQRFNLDESELVDWMFANPDGSEEGNIVGKFLDTYAPPDCRDTRRRIIGAGITRGVLRFA